MSANCQLATAATTTRTTNSARPKDRGHPWPVAFDKQRGLGATNLHCNYTESKFLPTYVCWPHPTPHVLTVTQCPCHKCRNLRVLLGGKKNPLAKTTLHVYIYIYIYNNCKGNCLKTSMCFYGLAARNLTSCLLSLSCRKFPLVWIGCSGEERSYMHSNVSAVTCQNQA